MRTTVVVGNPKPASRTLDAGRRLAEALMGRPADEVIDLIELGPGLLTWGDASVAAAVRGVQQSSFVVFASPTYKATYSGLLKLFLDQFPSGTGLADVVAAPLMLGAGPAHAMAPDLLLKAVLTELGATCAVPGLYLIDSAYSGDGVLAEYAARWAPTVAALTAGPDAGT